MSGDERLSFGEWLAGRPFGNAVHEETARMLEQAWTTAIARGLSGDEAMRRARRDPPLLDHYTVRVDPRGWPDPDMGPDGPFSREDAVARRTGPDPASGWRTIALRVIEGPEGET